MSATPAALRRYSPALLQQYVAGRHRSVEGWLFPTDVAVIAALGDIQTKAGIRGAVGEIGVHHGRLAILLYLMLHEGERGWCIDVFEQQELNRDNSGLGDSRIFRENLTRHGVRVDDVAIIAAASETVGADDLLRRAGETRLMSIDGGHTAEATQSDLRLGDRILCGRGVVILDDVFNKDWPGVIDGLVRFLGRDDQDLHPFAISTNKVFLCRRAETGFYGAQLREAAGLASMLVKSSAFQGHDVLIFGRDHTVGARQLSLKESIERTRAARIVRWYMTRLSGRAAAAAGR